MCIICMYMYNFIYTAYCLCPVGHSELYMSFARATWGRVGLNYNI